MQPTGILVFQDESPLTSFSYSSISTFLFCLLTFCTVWWLISCVILAGLWCPDMWSNIILDISVTVLNMSLTWVFNCSWKKQKNIYLTPSRENSASRPPLTWTLASALPGSLDCHSTLQILELRASIIMWSSSLK